MKLIIALSYLSVALAAPAATCDTYGPSCVEGVHVHGSESFNNTCGIRLNSNNWVLEQQEYSLTFPECISACADDSECCAVNYKICGGRCGLHKAVKGTCLELKYTDKPTTLFNAAYVVQGGGNGGGGWGEPGSYSTTN